jgi:hypothetical protein
MIFDIMFWWHTTASYRRPGKKRRCGIIAPTPALSGISLSSSNPAGDPGERPHRDWSSNAAS